VDDRRSEVLHGIGALLAVLVLTVGAPVALALAVGWPLPESVPNLEDISTAARSGIDETVIVKTLAVLGWLVWGQIALAITVEGVARLRGRPAPSVPIARGLQLAATQLLATAAVLLGSLTASGANPVPLSTLTPIELSQPIDRQPVERLPQPVLEPIAAREPLDHPTTEATDTYVVDRHDSWWGVAESELADGRRWQELRDLNVGRTMPDGHAIEPGTETLSEGWVLLLPTDGPLRGDPSPPASSTGRTVVVVEPGDNLWDLAEDCLEENLGRQAGDREILPYWQAVIEANRDVYVEPDNPSLIYPGQAIRLRIGSPEKPDQEALEKFRKEAVQSLMEGLKSKAWRVRASSRSS
jgi:nucleoid-associated protein YgaU